MKDPSKETPIAGALLFMLTGPILWAAHFLMVYSGQATICAWRSNGFLLLPEGYVSLLVLAVTVVAEVVLVYALWRPSAIARLLNFDVDDAENQWFATRAMRSLVALSIFGVTGGGAAALALDACI
ncbi:hypothetical protein FE840_019695 (plasmid) [Peteryoungia desertarenae]|uniref:Uncharacterized protein n=1 Tax=Peteryoungia desertarenae TaxID=1813451 RepID=A0ABX6QU67_9HYPH|nr:hypothetical protein [Peteryoungia desertarenae]QLF71827.1 hypothetical protein FE840_019695 [Peteryoungia desertarenae]